MTPAEREQLASETEHLLRHSESDDWSDIILAALERAAGEWVSVEERLPEHGQSVAFIANMENSGAYKFMHGQMYGGRYYKGDFGGFGFPGMVLEASHWMPLPLPPMPAPPTKGE
jgi:hypothetical protein